MSPSGAEGAGPHPPGHCEPPRADIGPLDALECCEHASHVILKAQQERSTDPIKRHAARMPRRGELREARHVLGGGGEILAPPHEHAPGMGEPR